MAESTLSEKKDQNPSEALDLFAEMFADLIWKQYWYERRKEWNEKKGNNHSTIRPSLHEGE